MKVKLNTVRLAFPDLREAVQYQGKGAFRYSATFLIEKGSENEKKILEAINAAANEKYGKKAESFLKQWAGNPQKHCYLDGSLKEYDGFEGMMYLSSHRRQDDGPVTIIGRDKMPLAASTGKPYAGCYVNASVDIYGQTGENTGIRCALGGVQFVKDGDAFSGSAPASPDEFEDLGVPDEEESLV